MFHPIMGFILKSIYRDYYKEIYKISNHKKSIYGKGKIYNDYLTKFLLYAVFKIIKRGACIENVEYQGAV